MATTIEELDKRQTVLEVRQKTLETERQTLAQGHADIRERQTRVEETDKRILEQLAFIRVEIRAVKTFFTWFVSLVVAIGILIVGLLNSLR